ncbi:MFS transporter [Erwinia tasmaniensis]|uniref:Resistance protein n=1 Tax=Erwinia tasmaniensis (strain DSM 17950 / CFBP 7177 / CIP 109463 / NCPPB 4357 / Et1/99) TaxID=465817 RepID=B2VDX4_ERWT9|nr:MFS transporter [Erwinia tasmaniensis]CAO96170.1 Putative resistance protein [Erwinia tasmaniensis Et1/99]
MNSPTASHKIHRTRCLTLIGTIITQFALGSVYTWSLFNGELSLKMAAPVSQIAFSFGLLSLSLALASSVAGKLQDRFGVRHVTLGAGLLMAIGLALTASANNLFMLYLSAGVLVGLADGAGYLMTLSNCVKWFPERKGVISACAIGAYGLGSLGFKFICGFLLSVTSLEMTFMIWAVIAMSMMTIGALLMKDAPLQAVSVRVAHTARDYSFAESVRMPQYWILALMFLASCMSGLYVIGIAKDIGEGMVHLSTQTAAQAVTIIAIANLSGRLILGILSDNVARIRVITLAQLVSLAGISILLFSRMNESTFFIAVACVAFSFGGTITVYPSLVSDFFGLNNLSKNYGGIYLGFGIGSVMGSLVASLFGGFTMTFSLIMGLMAISLLLSITVRAPCKAVEKSGAARLIAS